MKWSRSSEKFGSVYRSGPYKIEKYEGLLRGSAVWWVLTGPCGEFQRRHLSVAKRIAERHARAIAREEGRVT